MISLYNDQAIIFDMRDKGYYAGLVKWTSFIDDCTSIHFCIG